MGLVVHGQLVLSLATASTRTIPLPQDPAYSATDFCKHKNRGGCCVEVNPNWNNIPGYKHMADFCDKLCMPDGPGELAMCEPVPATSQITGTDPLDAIDEFYKEHPEVCNDKIGNWDEQNCQKQIVV